MRGTELWNFDKAPILFEVTQNTNVWMPWTRFMRKLRPFGECRLASPVSRAASSGALQGNQCHVRDATSARPRSPAQIGRSGGSLKIVVADNHWPVGIHLSKPLVVVDNGVMWPETDKTAELLDLARGGDESAVNQLIERHRNALRHLVRMRLDKKIQRRVDVSDVVQDVLIEANRRLQSYLENPAMPFHLWIRHIARDRIIDAHRRHRGSAKRSVDREQPMVIPGGFGQSSILLAGQLLDGEKTPAAQTLEKELARRVEEAITDLDEMDAEVIVMRHYEHLTNQEIAQALGLTEPAASMRYLRAVRRLRELLNH